MRLALLGSSDFALPTFEALRASHNILAVISQPDKPAGRGQSLAPTPVSRWAAEKLPAVPLLKPADINTPESIAAARALAGPGEADAWVIIAFGQKLSPELLDGIFATNLHGSLLPRWRGAGPVNAAILAGDAVAGNTAITIAQRMDAGLMLGHSSRAITPEMTAGELHDLLASDGPALIAEVLAKHSANTLIGREQDLTQITKARKLSRADGTVDFANPAESLRRTINGLSPWPGVTVLFRAAPLKLLRAIVSDLSLPPHATPGQLIDIPSGTIACGHNTALRLLDVQPAGKKPMRWADFANGMRPPLRTGTPPLLADADILIGGPAILSAPQPPPTTIA